MGSMKKRNDYLPRVLPVLTLAASGVDRQTSLHPRLRVPLGLGHFGEFAVSIPAQLIHHPRVEIALHSKGELILGREARIQLLVGHDGYQTLRLMARSVRRAPGLQFVR